MTYDPTKDIERLLHYGVQHHLIQEEDMIFVRNHLLDLFKLTAPYAGELTKEEIAFLDRPTSILEPLLDYGVEKGLIPDNTMTQRDLFDARIMGMLMPRQSEITKDFYQSIKYRGIEKATEDFYALSQASNYIRMDRIEKNKHWKTETPYGDLDITINLSKPEKDPREIAAAVEAAKTQGNSKYPKCPLCVENVGFAGNLNHPARQNHRVIPLVLAEEDWYFQYSPYVYYNEHCILFQKTHIPMHITEKTFQRLMDFLDQYPHYFIGSNTDLPRVGGSILAHEHYQGGRHTFPMEIAKINKTYYHKDYEGVQVGILHWPLSVLRLQSEDRTALIALAAHILQQWRDYSDETVDILAYSEEAGEKEIHNTITPISRMNQEGHYELDIVLRNNRATEQYPDGIFHPHPELHHIKKENIGLIEVMGLAILPGRLTTELKQIQDLLTGTTTWEALPEEVQQGLAIHEPWYQELKETYGTNLTEEEANTILQKEVGKKFERCLLDAGVYKQDERGQEAFGDFMKQSGFIQK